MKETMTVDEALAVISRHEGSHHALSHSDAYSAQEAPRLAAAYDTLASHIQAQAEEVAELRAARMAYASEFPLNEDGEPDVGNVHANIRALKAELATRTAAMIVSGGQALACSQAVADAFARQEAELARVREDARRLDFLDSCDAGVIRCDKNTRQFGIPSYVHWGFLGGPNAPKTLRAAIDALLPSHGERDGGEG